MDIYNFMLDHDPEAVPLTVTVINTKREAIDFIQNKDTVNVIGFFSNDEVSELNYMKVADEFKKKRQKIR